MGIIGRDEGRDVINSESRVRICRLGGLHLTTDKISQGKCLVMCDTLRALSMHVRQSQKSPCNPLRALPGSIVGLSISEMPCLGSSIKFLLFRCPKRVA